MSFWLRPGFLRNNLSRYRFHQPRRIRVLAREQHAVQVRPEGAVQVPGENTPRYVPKRTSYFSPAKIALGIIPILSLALGVWQVKRLKWKIDLIDELTEKLQRESISLPSNIDISAISELLHRKVLVRGHWDHAHTMLLGPRVMDGTRGYNVVTPLIRENGSTILVNRGWISEELSAPEKRHEPTGLIEIEGMLRATPARNMFTPENHPEKGEWYWADLSAMTDYAGGSKANVQPVYIEETFNGYLGEVTYRQKHGIPIGKATAVDLRNSHLSYAVTWFSLSAFTSYMFVRLMFKKGGRAPKGMPRRR